LRKILPQALQHVVDQVSALLADAQAFLGLPVAQLDAPFLRSSRSLYRRRKRGSILRRLAVGNDRLGVSAFLLVRSATMHRAMQAAFFTPLGD